MTNRWTNDPQRLEKRLLALIVLAHTSDVLENAFAPLNDENYEVAMRRVKTLLDLDFDVESQKQGSCELMWAVFESFNK